MATGQEMLSEVLVGTPYGDKKMAKGKKKGVLDYWSLPGMPTPSRKRVEVVVQFKDSPRVHNDMRNKSHEEIPGWRKIRGGILERDDYSCRMCHRDGTERRLDVHHIDWVRSHNEGENLVTLCNICHGLVHKEGYKPGDHDDDWPTPWGNRTDKDSWESC